jgi:hypothetical protein
VSVPAAGSLEAGEVRDEVDHLLNEGIFEEPSDAAYRRSMTARGLTIDSAKNSAG